MKKKLKIFIVFLSFILVVGFFYNEKSDEIYTEGLMGIDNSIDITSEKNATKTSVDINYTQSDKSKEIKPVVIEENMGIQMPKNVLDNAMNELRSKEFQNDMLLDIGFSESGVDKVLSDDKKKPLATTDLPLEIQKDINKTLEKIKKNGFDETSNEDSDEIVNIMDYIISNSEQVNNIRFTLSKIPNLVLNNYSYMGYTFPGIYSTEAVNGSYGTVRRVFQSFDSSHILIIEESGFNEGASSYSIEAFINGNVYGYPSRYMTMKSSNGNMYKILNWIIPNYSFRLYYVSDAYNQAKQTMFDIANSLSEINIQKKDENNIIKKPSKETVQTFGNPIAE